MPCGGLQAAQRRSQHICPGSFLACRLLLSDDLQEFFQFQGDKPRLPAAAMNHHRQRMAVCVPVGLPEGRRQGKAFHSLAFDVDAHRADFDRNIGVVYAADILLIVAVGIQPVRLQQVQQLPFCPVSFTLAVHHQHPSFRTC